MCMVICCFSRFSPLFSLQVYSYRCYIAYFQNLSEFKISLSIFMIFILTLRVKEQERAAELLKDHYENEIQDLRNLVRRQQKQLEDMVNDKR